MLNTGYQRKENLIGVCGIFGFLRTRTERMLENDTKIIQLWPDELRDFKQKKCNMYERDTLLYEAD